jgi:hypothetical protein
MSIEIINYPTIETFDEEYTELTYHDIYEQLKALPDLFNNQYFQDRILKLFDITLNQNTIFNNNIFLK